MALSVCFIIKHYDFAGEEARRNGPETGVTAFTLPVSDV